MSMEPHDPPAFTAGDALVEARGHEEARFKKQAWSGAFREFLEQKLYVDPARYTRTAYQLVVDMLDHYGTEGFEDAGETLTRRRLFDDPFNDGHNRIFGLDRTIGRLVKYLRAAAREEGKERIFVLHGPVGTAKTSLLDLLARGLEEYTGLPEGDVLTFRWVFPKNFDQIGATMGFVPQAREFSDQDIAVSLPCQMRDNPLLLIPREPRRRLLTDLFARRYGRGENHRIVPRKVLDGDLCYNCRQIYDALHARFQGDFEQIVRFTRVERFVMSSTLGVGVAKVLPEGNIEAGVAPITIDENYRFIMNLISSLNLVRFAGPYARANRGIIHYSDIYKKQVVYLQHLLSAVEEHKISWGDITSDIDVLIVGTTNAPEYEAMRKNPTSKALRSRSRKIDVPYLLNYRDEMKIYDRGLAEARRRITVTPHCTELAALFAVLTRLEKTMLHRDSDLDHDTRAAVETIAALDKTLLYGGEWPEEMDLDTRAHLTKEVLRRLRNEFPTEGMDGVPTRILQNLFADLCEAEDGRAVHPFELFDGFERVISQGPVNYDFLAHEEDEGYHDFEGFARLLRKRYDQTLAREVRDSVVEVDPAELERRIKEYLAHVSAHNRQEKVTDPVTGARVDPDEQKMRAVEERLAVPDDKRKQWRFDLIGRASQHLRAGQPIDLRAVYKDLFDALFHGIYEDKKKAINWSGIRGALEKCETADALEKEPGPVARQSLRLAKNLVARHGYDYGSARRNLLYFIKKNLDG
ncbi:MAG: hypothetical protein HY719_17755 [Planctomycetes bacterium]|nr:hypothetical protein [Planctomycetota bacterium]